MTLYFELEGGILGYSPGGVNLSIPLWGAVSAIATAIGRRPGFAIRWAPSEDVAIREASARCRQL